MEKVVTGAVSHAHKLGHNKHTTMSLIYRDNVWKTAVQ